MHRLWLIAVLPLLMAPSCPAPAPSPTPTPTVAPTPTPEPTPTPTPGDGCGEPAPPPAYELTVKVHAAFCANLDSTVKVQGAAYCAAIGFTDGRSVCPVRMEGASDRVACERRVLGRQQWRCADGCQVYPCVTPGNCECAGQVNTNPAQAIYVGKGTVTTCTEDGKVCGSVLIR